MEHEHVQQGQRQPDFPIAVRLEISHFPPVFDLSLSHPFEISLEMKRGRKGDDNPQPLTILKTLSTLDSVYALSTGLLQLIDLESDTIIDLEDMNKTTLTKIPGIQASMNNDNFITLPARDLTARPLRRRGYDFRIDLGFPVNVKDRLKVGHKYRLQLVSTDLSIKWWGWGSPSELSITNDTTLETLPPSEQGRLIASALTHKEFTVIESFSTPPLVKVTLEPTLSPLLVLTQNSNKTNGDPIASLPSFCITITNNNPRPITVKSNYTQPFITPIEYQTWPCSMHPRLTYQHSPPHPINFSLVDIVSAEELNPLHVSPSGRPDRHNARRNYTTLQPSVPIVLEMKLPPRLVEKARGRRCRLTVRPFGVWWTLGTIDELFKLEDGKPMQRAAKRQQLPLMLQSDDQVIFKI